MKLITFFHLLWICFSIDHFPNLHPLGFG